VVLSKKGSLEASVLGPARDGYVIDRPPDIELFIDFLRCILTLDPTKRATCQELLNHMWLHDDAVPAKR
jgi:serine/threonine protein kinase